MTGGKDSAMPEGSMLQGVKRCCNTSIFSASVSKEETTAAVQLRMECMSGEITRGDSGPVIPAIVDGCAPNMLNTKLT